MEAELCQALHLAEELHRNAGVSRPFSINQMYWAGKSELCCNLTSRLVRSNIINSLWQYAALSAHLYLDAGDIISRFNESDEEETPSGVESSAAVRVTCPHSVVVVTSTEDAPGCSCRHTGTTLTTFTHCACMPKGPAWKMYFIISWWVSSCITHVEIRCITAERHYLNVMYWYFDISGMSDIDTAALSQWHVVMTQTGKSANNSSNPHLSNLWTSWGAGERIISVSWVFFSPVSEDLVSCVKLSEKMFSRKESRTDKII